METEEESEHQQKTEPPAEVQPREAEPKPASPIKVPAKTGSMDAPNFFNFHMDNTIPTQGGGRSMRSNRGRALHASGSRSIEDVGAGFNLINLLLENWVNLAVRKTLEETGLIGRQDEPDLEERDTKD